MSDNQLIQLPPVPLGTINLVLVGLGKLPAEQSYAAITWLRSVTEQATRTAAAGQPGQPTTETPTKRVRPAKKPAPGA